MGEPTFTLAMNRYYAIRKRSFNKMLDLFLFEPILEDGDLSKCITPDSFFEFIEPQKDPIKRKDQLIKREELINRNRRAWKLSKNEDLIEGKLTVAEASKKYNDWYDHNKELYVGLQEVYNRHFISDENFKRFYGSDEKTRKCYYCHITEEKIHELSEKDKIYTKRLSTRGRTMEIDRINPNGEYEEENIVLCCYWCNNAKTDEFNEAEFRTIGAAIQKIWEDRLS